jgi:hypothetical protein
MSTTMNKEYKVLLTHRLLTESASGQQACWRATVLGFPYLVEEAESREQVLCQLQARLEEMTQNAEVVTLTAPVPSLVHNGSEDELTAHGWDDHGLFKDDWEAVQLFDAIEAERDRQVVGGE